MSVEDDEAIRMKREASEDFWIGFIGAFMVCLILVCCVLIWRAA